MHSFTNFEPVKSSSLVLTVASFPAYRFCKRQVRWSGIPISKNFPGCCDSHKEFRTVSEAEVDFPSPWNPLVFYITQQMLAIWSLVPLAFLNPTCTPESSQFTNCWSLARKIYAQSVAKWSLVNNLFLQNIPEGKKFIFDIENMCVYLM